MLLFCVVEIRPSSSSSSYGILLTDTSDEVWATVLSEENDRKEIFVDAKVISLSPNNSTPFYLQKVDNKKGNRRMSISLNWIGISRSK